MNSPAVYGSECWAVKKSQEEKTRIVKMRMLQVYEWMSSGELSEEIVLELRN